MQMNYQVVSSKVTRVFSLLGARSLSLVHFGVPFVVFIACNIIVLLLRLRHLLCSVVCIPACL